MLACKSVRISLRAVSLCEFWTTTARERSAPCVCAAFRFIHMIDIGCRDARLAQWRAFFDCVLISSSRVPSGTANPTTPAGATRRAKSIDRIAAGLHSPAALKQVETRMIRTLAE
jgi:hypothetical protein